MPSSEYEVLNTVSESAQVIITVCSVLSLILTISSCVCCRKTKFRDQNAMHGVSNPSATPATFTDTPVSQSVQFRPAIRVEKAGERRTQSASECDHVTSDDAMIRVSAPLQTGRALPKLPLDMYSVICKTRKANTAFLDEDGNPTYETIDPENDSLIDPLYSKLGEVVSSRPERKYDYPVFSGRKTSAPTHTDDAVVYQSASQVYTICGSEDPYSSITSEPRRSSTVVDRGDYNSSIYDAGYAKVRQGASNSTWRKENLERTELEVDQLYSKIRRSPVDTADDFVSIAKPSHLTMERKMEDRFAPSISPQCSKTVDTESLSSREPSYRYITVRENADVVRERLRLQGQLVLPTREHYYSVIGNEYETVGDAHSTYAYSAVEFPRNQGMLNVTTTLLPEFIPPPPTSPIPDRTPCATAPAVATDLLQSSHNNHDVVAPLYSAVFKSRVTTSNTEDSADNAVAGSTDDRDIEPHLPEQGTFESIQRISLKGEDHCRGNVITDGRELMEVNRAKCSKEGKRIHTVSPHTQGVNGSRSADTSFSKTLR